MKRGSRSGRRQNDRQTQSRATHSDKNVRWIVGLHSCEEVLKIRPGSTREVWLRSDWKRSEALRGIEEFARKSRIKISEKSPGQLDQVSAGHQGVAVACTEAPEVDWDKLESSQASLVLILDGLEDPQNFGAIIRTAWLAGVDVIFTPIDRAVGLTASVCKVASGGAEHVPIEAATNVVVVLERLKKAGFWIYGLAESGKKRPWDLSLAKKTAWVIGSESSGIRTATERACDEIVRLPQVASGSSFNAAIACAMALAETCRQFGKPE